MNKKTLAAFSLLVALFLATASFHVLANAESETAPAAATAKEQQRVLVNLKHYTDDLHAAFMALKIANGLQERDAKVTLFLNLEGVRLADKGTPGDLRWGKSEATPGLLLAQFIEAGGTVLVCPHCANAAGLSPESLRDGTRVAANDEVMDAFMVNHKVISY